RGAWSGYLHRPARLHASPSLLAPRRAQAVSASNPLARVLSARPRARYPNVGRVERGKAPRGVAIKSYLTVLYSFSKLCFEPAGPFSRLFRRWPRLAARSSPHDPVL